MTVDCPKCDARLRVPADHDPDERLTCLKCKAKFRVETDEGEEAEEKPRKNAARRAESDDEDAPKKKTGKKKRKADDEDADPNRTAKIVGAGVGGVLALGVIVLAAIYFTRDTKKPTETAGNPPMPAQPVITPNPNPPGPGPNPPNPNPVNPSPPKNDPPAPPKKDPLPQVQNGPDGFPLPPAFVKTMFETRAERKAPTTFMPSLIAPPDIEYDMPSFAAAARKGPKPPAAPQGVKLTVEDVKKAVVYIKVDAGESSATGSGFLVRVDGDTGLIATNSHVVTPAVMDQLLAVAGISTPDGTKAGVQVVFDSGQPTEQVRDAEVIAADPDTDLAILRVTKLPKAIKPIDPRAATKPSETLPVLICGFPFGDQLAVGKRNPNITIGKGAVSSVRLKDSGAIANVQIDGSLNPGNSGGPCVDADGRLVGVSVATIKGTGIGMAIPADELVAMLDGRMLSPFFIPVGVKNGTADFRALVPVPDPLRLVKSAAVLVGPVGATAPEDANGLWKPMAGATRVELKPARVRGLTEGEVKLPVADKGATVQLSVTYTSGLTVLSRPVPFLVSLNPVLTDGDTIPLADVMTTPGRYEGQTVAMSAAIGPHIGRLWSGVYRLHVRHPTDEDAANPPGLEFFMSRDIATQVADIPMVGRTAPVRLTCLVGKARDGQTMIRVVAVDVIGRGQRIVQSIPAPPADELSRLNQNPEKAIGKTVAVVGVVPLKSIFRGPTADLGVRTPRGDRAPLNLAFQCPRALAEALAASGQPDDVALARLTCTVDAFMGPEGKFGVHVTRIELLGAGGKVVKVIE